MLSKLQGQCQGQTVQLKQSSSNEDRVKGQISRHTYSLFNVYEQIEKARQFDSFIA